MRDVVFFRYERPCPSLIPGGENHSRPPPDILFFTLFFFYGTNSGLDFTPSEPSHQRNFIGDTSGGQRHSKSNIRLCSIPFTTFFLRRQPGISVPGLCISKGPVPRSGHIVIAISTTPIANQRGSSSTAQ